MSKGDVDVVIVAAAKPLYVDTSPLWMDKFIATVKRRGLLIADVKAEKAYDLRQPADEDAFRVVS